MTENRLVDVATNLTSVLRQVVQAVPGGPFRSQEFARALSLNKDLSNRLFRALKKHDPLAALSVLPGPVPLRQLMKAASERGVNETILSELGDSISAFDRLIRSDVEGRAGLEAVLSANLPAVRDRYEATAKQEMQRSVARLKGVTADVSLVTFLGHPSATDGARCDTAMLGGFVGLRRIRPGAPIQFTSVLDESGPRRSHLGGTPVADATSPLLEQFCSPADLPIDTEVSGDRVCYSVRENSVGLGTALNVFLAEFYPANNPRVPLGPEDGRRWFYATVEQPSRVLVLDVLLHRSMWPGATVAMRQYDTVINGIVRPNDESRNRDMLDLAESVQDLGSGLSKFRCDDIPNYLDMIAYVAGRRNWAIDEFRGYRCLIAYPFYGAQVCMTFDLARLSS